MGKIVLSVAHSIGFYNEERPHGRCEELTLFVVKNALRLLRRLRRGAPQNEELALLVE